MGYTHYWTQKRDFTEAEWDDITSDVSSLIKATKREGAQ